MKSDVQMFSKRLRRWIPDMPIPYPPFWWERAIHFVTEIFWPHSHTKMATCRVCKDVEYKNFRDYHGTEV